jgi:hypothetical protein
MFALGLETADGALLDDIAQAGRTEYARVSQGGAQGVALELDQIRSELIDCRYQVPPGGVDLELLTVRVRDGTNTITLPRQEPSPAGRPPPRSPCPCCPELPTAGRPA